MGGKFPQARVLASMDQNPEISVEIPYRIEYITKWRRGY